MKLRLLSRTTWSQATLFVVYLIAFLNSFHIGLSIYIESSYIKEVMSAMGIEGPERFVGLLFTAGAALTTVLFFNIAKVLTVVGNFLFALLSIVAEIASLLVLAFMPNHPILLIAAFIAHLVVVNMIIFTNDLFTETLSSDETTGSIRGTLLTTGSIAFILSPFIGGLILTDGDFWKLFFAAAVVLAPTIVLLIIKFHDYDDPPYATTRITGTFREIWNRPNILYATLTGFLLRFFYAWMVVYTPLYLKDVMGLSYSDIVGIVIPIAMLPFVLLEYALGKIADVWLGEQELLIAGFAITGITTAAISFLSSGNPFFWAGVLFLTRIGASFIESMTETYFFKQIGPKDAHLIGYFRNTRSIAYIIAPLIASILLTFIDFRYLFLILGGIMLGGVYFASRIEDTK